MQIQHFSPAQRITALALATALLPPGRLFPGADDTTLQRLEVMLNRFGKKTVTRYGKMLSVLEQATRLTHRGQPFSRLSQAQREQFLATWTAASDLPRRTLAFALCAPIKIAYFDDPAIHEALRCTFRFGKPVTDDAHIDLPMAPPEQPRWMQQVTPGESLTHDVELECDVVVVGTGAGGAVMAKELATKGFAVVMLEEGRYHNRADFTGGSIESATRFYRLKGTLGSVGNTFILLPAGRLVGGSTAINTGTCWRTPDRVLQRWVDDEGLVDLAPDRMAPYFERVETELQVEEADRRYLGGAARVIARGCDVLGYSHRPVMRNAPGCDGSGICDFGCPTDARRSTNVSYVPAALRANAFLYTGVRAQRILMEGGRAVGIEARNRATGRLVTVRARATVLSCGTIMTPLLLMQHDIHRTLPLVGQRLSVHPATIVSALFDEEILGYSAIPQGYCVDEFRKEGILLLGASAPIDLGAGQFAFVGHQLMNLMEAYDRVASFGIMVEDRSIGSVRPGPKGRPLVYYKLGEQEQEKLRRGVEIVARIFLAAGAHEVYPALHGHRILRNSQDLARVRRARTAAADWILTGFHPLGTCRMATSPKEGVVSPHHEVYGVRDLYLADGSVIPSSVAVNPQVTIMAFATRAADLLAARLEAAS